MGPLSVSRIAFVVFTLAVGPAAHALLIDLHTGCLPAACMPGEFGHFADGTARVAGQTITAPSENLLDEFSFWVATNRNPQYSPQDVAFRGMVLPWDSTTNRASGPPIYVSNPVQLVAGLPFTQVTFATSGVELTPGNTYVIAIGSVGLENPHPGDYTLADLASPSAELADTVNYPGGSLVNLYAASMEDLASREWNVEARHEMEFRAAFSSIRNSAPEPVTWVLSAAALAALLAIRPNGQAPRAHRLISSASDIPRAV